MCELSYNPVNHYRQFKIDIILKQRVWLNSFYSLHISKIKTNLFQFCSWIAFF